MIELADGLIDQTDIQKKMAQSLIDQRAQIISLQFAVLAVAEQLAAAGNLDASLAAQRIFDMAKTVEPEKMRAAVKPKATLLAARLDALSSPTTPRPPRGSRPRIVK